MASVASRNPFALLDEDGSPAAAPAPAKKTPAPATEAPKKTSTNARTGPASRGGKYYARGGGRPAGDGNPNQDGIQDAGESGRRPEGRGRGRGGRGGARGRGGQRFDRHSQTGKTDTDKKVHQGWGGDDGNAELKDEAAADTDAAKEATAGDSWDTPATDGAAAAGGDDKPPRKERTPEPEDNTLTLEQYLAQEKEKLDVPELETRQVSADWKDVKPLEKEEEETYFVGKTKTSAPKARQAKERESVEVNFAPPPREGGGRGRGGRGGRGGFNSDRPPRARGSGRGRGGRQQNGSSQVNVDDTSAFPALS